MLPSVRPLRRSPRVATRILMAAGVAGVIAVLLMVSLVATQDRQADRTERLADGTNAVSGLMELRVARFQENALLKLGQLGVEFGALDQADATAAVSQAREETDRALAELGTSAPFSSAELAADRMGPASSGANEAIKGQPAELDRKVESSLSESISDIESLAVQIGDRETAGDLRELVALVDVSTSSQALLLEATDYWFAEPDELVATQSGLAKQMARFEDHAAALSALAPSSIRDDALDTLAVGSALDVAIAEQLDGTASATRGGPVSGELLTIFSDGLTRATQFSPEVASAGQRLAAQSLRQADAARDARNQAAIGAIGILAMAMAVSLAFARSISAPLERLSETARRVSDGDLHVEPLRPSGPPEVIEAAMALNDTVANLRLIERKAEALAASDLSAEVLDVPLPGGIGKAMSQSVTVLADSVAASDALRTRLAFDATHDELTGVINRAAALAQLGESLASRPKEQVAVTFIDLDDFKRINDSHGHATGDDILREVGKRLDRAVGDQCQVARIGGDEFLLVFSKHSLDDAVVITRKALADLAVSALPGPQHLTVTACAGLAGSQAGDDALTLLRRADVAAYHAKKSGPGSLASYDDELHRYFSKQADIEDALRHAITHNTELELFYQPLMSGDGALPVGVEALIRWNRPGSGQVRPDEFVPVAERSPLIADLDRWVLDAALTQLAMWSSDPLLAHMSMSVNLSGRHLVHPSIVSDVSCALDRSGVDPRRLILEVTETALVTDLKLMAARLRQLQDLGVHTAMDDFGTGFTGFAHLRTMPINEIKIDRSLTNSVIGNPKERQLLDLVCVFARFINARIVAEGIETQAEAEMMRELGCDVLQGYYYARPMPAEAATAWLRARSRPPPSD